ncbi:MAG: hypothetical protein ACK4FF_07835 [Limnobacter sp.]|uniref:hypothetical protein n=1 Tax=Limnobacter sp. TaxID=2003368 RepID=UPI00391B0D0A
MGIEEELTQVDIALQTNRYFQNENINQENAILFIMKETFDPIIFVLRRAWTLGKCDREAVDRAFGTGGSPARASKILGDATRHPSGSLMWVKRVGVVPKHGAACPAEASIDLILEKIARGEPPQSTGIFDDDGVGIVRPKIRALSTLSEAATRVVVEGALRDEPIQILYVGLKKDETAKWRTVWPCTLEYTGKGFRLHAHDLNDPEAQYPVKLFLLSRILDAQKLDVKATKKSLDQKFVRRGHIGADVSVHVSLNQLLTPDQEKVVRHELGINASGKVRIPRHLLYEFRKENEGLKSSALQVWPLLSSVVVGE